MSERLFCRVVALRDRASGRYLGIGAAWSGDASDALLLDEIEATTVVRRFACEAEAIELVPADELDDDGASRAVA